MLLFNRTNVITTRLVISQNLNYESTSGGQSCLCDYSCSEDGRLHGVVCSRSCTGDGTRHWISVDG